MDEKKQNSIEPWGSWEYGTGRTSPPKSHSTLIAVLLVLIILLCSVVSVLSVLNIRMFQQLNRRDDSDTRDDIAAFAQQVQETTVPTQEALSGSRERTGMTVDIHGSPEVKRTGEESDQAEQTGELTLQEIYAQNIPSVVSITCTTASGTSTGTGVILSAQGYIVTNAHVIDNAGSISLLLSDGRETQAEVVGTDSVSDLAVLYIDADDLTGAQFGDSDALQVGDAVAAIGDPLGASLRGTMTNGIISAINRDVVVSGVTMSLLQTNAALNSGNSGGPLINVFGQVIGINTMKISAFSNQAGVEGLGFAIPSATVKTVVEQIIAYGYVPGRPTLGIDGEELSQFSQHFYRIPAGMYVSSVTYGGAADEAGLQTGDILLAIDGESVISMDDVNRIVSTHSVGDSVLLHIYRGGREGILTAAIGEAKE